MMMMKIIPLLLLLLIQTYFTLAQIPDTNTTSYLPPTMMELSSPEYIFSGFGNTYLVNVNSKTYSKVISDFEQSCCTCVNDTPFYSRLYVVSNSKAFYYCPSKNILYILDPSNNWAVQSNQISLGSAATFNEVKFMISKADSNSLYILGLVSTPMSSEGPTVNKYTNSYLVKVDITLEATQSLTMLTGAHGEPIVQIELMLQNEVIAVGEQMYANKMRLNTYYIGQLTDKNFNRVVDFYMAYSSAFMPQVKISPDSSYVLYTNERSMFRYERMSGRIIQFANVTMTNAQFNYKGNLYTWGKIPFTISSSGKNVYVYNQGGFATLDLKTMTQKTFTPVPWQVSNVTDCQVFYLKNGNLDEALFQADNQTVLIPFKDGASEAMVEKLRGFLEY
jgi:hypothetical protein